MFTDEFVVILKKTIQNIILIMQIAIVIYFFQIWTKRYANAFIIYYIKKFYSLDNWQCTRRKLKSLIKFRSGFLCANVISILLFYVVIRNLSWTPCHLQFTHEKFSLRGMEYKKNIHSITMWAQRLLLELKL
jgi:hypothetical protein